MDQLLPDAETRFAAYVTTLGRGPGRSRALTRPEARDAFGLILADAVHPAQVGAFLMLLRYRGEDPDEITGLVEAARTAIAITPADMPGQVDLDWPSYGAGRTRGAPWFLLSALALAQTGLRVLMHGTNEFSGGMPVAAGLAVLGLSSITDVAMARGSLDGNGFAYWPVALLSPGIDRLLGMRRLFGLRSPVNTVARLIDPATARASVDGVFHPPYIALHLGVAERLERPSLLVVKGGGGEAERSPAKPVAAHLWRHGQGRVELLLPPIPASDPMEDRPMQESFVRLWRREGGAATPAEQTVIGTMTLALLALEPGLSPERADRRAAEIWNARNPS